MAFFDAIMWPFSWVVSFILSTLHTVFTWVGLPYDSGWTWTISTALLVVFIRTLLIPLFVRQIKSQRGMQIVQPELQKLQAKYKGKKDQVSRQKMVAEQQALFKKNGVNPFMTCLPLLAQMPFFFAMFWMLNRATTRQGSELNPYRTEGYFALSGEEVISLDESSIFGVGLSDVFWLAAQEDPIRWNVLVLAVVLIITMVGSQFFTQKQLMSKNMSESAKTGQFAQMQTIMLYVFPLVMIIGGVNFPIALVIYWTTTNLWTLCQQWWVIRNNPTPGSLAEKELNIRRQMRGLPPIGEEARKAREEAEKPKPTGKHLGNQAQPARKRKKKKKKKGQR